MQWIIVLVLALVVVGCGEDSHSGDSASHGAPESQSLDVILDIDDTSVSHVFIKYHLNGEIIWIADGYVPGVVYDDAPGVGCHSATIVKTTPVTSTMTVDLWINGVLYDQDSITSGPGEIESAVVAHCF